MQVGQGLVIRPHNPAQLAHPVVLLVDELIKCFAVAACVDLPH